MKNTSSEVKNQTVKEQPSNSTIENVSTNNVSKGESPQNVSSKIAKVANLKTNKIDAVENKTGISPNVFHHATN